MDGKPFKNPIGIDDFRTIREGGYTFVDKSGLISRIVTQKKYLLSFSRPKGFGKSVNLSMIDCFFNLEYEGNRWFEGMEVMECEDAVQKKNRYPVVHIRMSDLSMKSYGSYIDSLRSMISGLQKHFSYLTENEQVRRFFERSYICGDASGFTDIELENYIFDLTWMLEIYHGRRAIVLIDDHDAVMNGRPGKDLDRIVSSAGRLYGEALKGNEHLEFGIVTGTMQFEREPFYGGGIHFNVESIVFENYSQWFGFTSEETKALCASYGQDPTELRRWFGGYRIGNREMIEPRGVIECLGLSGYPLYPGDPIGDEILESLIGSDCEWVRRKIIELAEGKEVPGTMPFYVVSTDRFDSPSASLSVLASLGYLRFVKTELDFGDFSVPNLGVLTLIKKMIPGCEQDARTSRS